MRWQIWSQVWRDPAECSLNPADNDSGGYQCTSQLPKSVELRQIGWQFQRQIWGFRPRSARGNWPRGWLIATRTDNRKWQYRRFGRQSFLVVDRCRNHLANLLSSSSWRWNFKRYLSEFQRCNYFRFGGPYHYRYLSLLYSLANTIFHIHMVLITLDLSLDFWPTVLSVAPLLQHDVCLSVCL